jgi:hypothetical protein
MEFKQQVYRYRIKHSVGSSKYFPTIVRGPLCINWDFYTGYALFRMYLPEEIRDELGLEFVEAKEIQVEEK